MDADINRERLDGLTRQIIGSAQRVSSALGNGFLERVYQNALAVELKNAKLPFATEVALQVRYDGQIVGDYKADMLVDGEIIVELKAVTELDAVHKAQCMNYLKATGLKVCLLLNFGKPKLEVKRIVNGF
jgi:GxxExxY protein